MTARTLAWYTCGALALSTLLHSAATVAPSFQATWQVILLVTGILAAAAGVLGVVLQSLPPEHWCNRSRTLRVGLSVAAVLATLSLIG
jgi:hypothetical protein